MAPQNQNLQHGGSMKSDLVQVEAKSIEQALVKAAGILNVTQEELEYQVVKEETPKGLFSFFKNPSVLIDARVKKSALKTLVPERKQQPPQNPRNSQKPELPRLDNTRFSAADDEDDDDNQEVKESLPPEKVAALTEELKDFCGGIIQRISGEDPKISALVEDGRLILTSDNEYLGQQISRNSKLAEAMEHILRKKPRHLRQELPFRIFIDVGGMRRKREDELIQMAMDLSIKVHENRRPIVLNYKSSYDRKIIHMALDKDHRVYTKSIGSGPNRKLMILPNKYSSSEDDRTPHQSPQVIDVD